MMISHGSPDSGRFGPIQWGWIILCVPKKLAGHREFKEKGVADPLGTRDDSMQILT